MLEKEYIIQAIEEYKPKMYDGFNGYKYNYFTRIDKAKNLLYFFEETINEDGQVDIRPTVYDLNEFIKDCQEKLPIALYIEEKYKGCLLNYGSAEMAFILDIYKKATKLQDKAK